MLRLKFSGANIQTTSTRLAHDILVQTDARFGRQLHYWKKTSSVPSGDPRRAWKLRNNEHGAPAISCTNRWKWRELSAIVEHAEVARAFFPGDVLPHPTRQSPAATPTNASSPQSIRETTRSSTRTSARATRWTTALMHRIRFHHAELPEVAA